MVTTLFLIPKTGTSNWTPYLFSTLTLLFVLVAKQGIVKQSITEQRIVK